jgi:hypothetical protein
MKDILRDIILILSGGFLGTMMFVMFLFWFFSGGELEMQWNSLAWTLGIPAVIFIIALLAKGK